MITSQESEVAALKYDEKHAVEIMKLLDIDRKETNKFCDGWLRSKGQDHAVHKCIVGVSSVFFQGLFYSEIHEKYVKVANIENLSHETIGIILDYIYTGSVDITEDNVYDLLDGAEYTQITGLKTECKNYMLDAVHAKNCVKYQVFARRYNLTEVQKKAGSVIAKHLKNVIEQNDFQELDVEGVSSIITIECFEMSADVMYTGLIRWVKHNDAKRQKLFAKLFALMDVSTFSADFLNRVVTKEALVFNSLDCMQHLVSLRGFGGTSHSDEMLLIMGGVHSEQSCMLHDFSARNIRRLPDLLVERSFAVAEKVNGVVYVAGGYDDGCDSAEMLKLPDGKNWEPIAMMLKARDGHASAVLNGLLYVTGGSDADYNTLSSCEKYDCAIDEWLNVSEMLESREYHDMVCFEDSLYAVGGSNGTKALNSCERYHATTDEWQFVTPMNKKRDGLAAVALGGYIYAIGGKEGDEHDEADDDDDDDDDDDNDDDHDDEDDDERDGDSTDDEYDDSVLAYVEKYDPKTDAWTALQPLNVARCYSKACVVNGKIYVVGGKNRRGKYLKSVEVYDERKDAWKICFELDASGFEGITVLSV